MLSKPYPQLETRFARLTALGDAEGMLHWDMAALMPPGGAEARAEQLAALKTVRHEILTAPEMADLLAGAEATPDLDPWQRANLREMKRIWTQATALSEELVEALSRAESACEMVWRRARAEADFKAVLPSLERLLDLVREGARAKSEKLGLGPYDALLNQYEPGGSADSIDAVFADLEDFLPPFLARVLERQAEKPAVHVPEGPFPASVQRGLGLQLMEALGFDFEHGRLDESLHPFCGGTPDDVRITARYDESDFTSGLMAVLHETGHALYERGLPKNRRGQPVGKARGMSVHESQSLLVEMQVCRSADFLTFAAPIMRAAFDGAGPAWETENLYRHYSRVEPGFIRVDADEVTYPLHVILRYPLERAMIEGGLEARDLPGAWNEGMKKLLGLTPPDDGLGCLQDIHWYDGAWGYFPTYTLGAMTAAQIYRAACDADPAIPAGIPKGDFRPLFAWLGEHIHGQGSLKTGPELLTQSTGRPLDASAFKAHLERRYLA